MNNDKWKKFKEAIDHLEHNDAEWRTAHYVSRALFGLLGIAWLSCVDEVTLYTALIPTILLGIALFAPKRFHLYVWIICQFFLTFG